MSHIAGLIESGSMTFLKKEYSILVGFLAIVTALLYWKLGSDTALCYLCGAFASMLCGFIGIKAATKANVRTAQAARSGQGFTRWCTVPGRDRPRGRTCAQEGDRIGHGHVRRLTGTNWHCPALQLSLRQRYV